LARQGGARSPIGGAVNIPGSPAFLAAQQRSAQQQAAILSAEIARQARLGGARSSVRGATDIPGSPAFLAAQKRAGEIQARAYVTEVSRLARQGGARSPIGGAVDIPGSPAFLAAQRRFSAQDLSRAAAIGGPRSPIGGALNLPGSPAALKAEQRLAEARAKAAKAANDAAVAEGRRIGRLNAAPVRGGAAFAGSPAFLDAQFPAFPAEFFRKQKQDQAKQQRAIEQGIKRRNDILSNALIGGAFPALFGQGLGASLGGAAGGAAGGAIGGQFGFGLSLVGTALGAQFDAALNKAKELAKALDNPIAQFSAIKDNALLSSKGLEKNVEALIATGREAEAAALIQQDLAKTFGNAEEVQNFVNETDKLNRAWTETSVTLAAFVAGPLAGLLGRLNQPIRGFNAAGRVARATAGLAPDQRAQVEQFTRRRQRELGVPGIAATDAQSLQLNLDILAEIERIQGRNNNALARAASNQKILTQSASTLINLEDAIGRARIGGNKSIEDSLTLSKELLTNYRERKSIEQQLAAKQIKPGQATELTGQSLAKDRTLRQQYVDSTRESLINATKELETTKQLSGLEGTRLEVAQRRIELSKAFGLRELRGQQLTDARTDASLNPGNENFRVLLQGALQNFTAAGVDFETKLRQASDYLQKAAKDAATNLTNAFLNLGKLETDPGGLNRFLTGDEQFESNRRAILRLGGDGSKGPSQLESAITKATELLGLTRNQANERFQGLRDIVSDARQGRFASQEGFNTLSAFFEDVRSREQAVTGVGDAQRTLADVTSLNVTVQQELVGAVRQNTLALEAVFGKDWSVNLAVQGGEVAAYGDVISRNLTP
jgi:hypothetical protein